MRVIVTGATGFIGRHISHALVQAGQHVTGVARDREDAFRRFPDIGWIRADFARDRTIDSWERRLTGYEDVVINAAGILRERGANTFEAVHYEGPRALFNACAAKGIRRVIHVSALGCDPASKRPYEETKLRLERYLRTLDLDWVILRPSLVYGEDSPSSRLFRALADLPVVPLIGDGGQRLQPIAVDELARSVADMVASGTPRRTIVELGGPRAVTYREFLRSLRTAPREPAYLRVPPALARIGARVGIGPLTTDTFNMLMRGNTIEKGENHGRREAHLPV